MGVVSNDQSPPADSAQADQAANVAPEANLSNLVTRVDLTQNKAKLRNILLGVAGFFLILSALIFMMSRKKKAAAPQ